MAHSLRVTVLLGLALPITPVQILWINMITAVTLGMALAWERAEGDLMRRSPRPIDEPLLTPFMIWRIGLVGLLLLLGVGLLFLQEQARETPVGLAVFVVVELEKLVVRRRSAARSFRPETGQLEGEAQ